MKSLLGAWVLGVAALLAGAPARAAIELNEQVERLPGATAEEGCAWEAVVATATAAGSGGYIVPAKPTAASAGTSLDLQVVQLKLDRTAKGGDYAAVLRANVRRAGKLVGTRDFLEEDSYKNGKPPCDTLRAIGNALAVRVVDWATTARFMECRDDCTGIHPDETIVVGTQVMLGAADALNDTVRNDCRFQTAMVKELVKSYNEIDPAPRAKLEARAIDVAGYPGRRLLLRVNNVHALGGGGWTGPKWMDMSGELWDGKAMVGSFDSHTEWGGGFTTCRSVESLSGATIELIVEWLRGPSIGAKLR